MRVYRKKPIKGTTIRYESPQGKSGTFELNFDDPAPLFKTLEDLAGYDFALQFQDEFEAWYAENVSSINSVIDESTKNAGEYADNVSSGLSQLRDILNEINDYANDVLDEDDVLMEKAENALDLLEDAEDDISNTLGELNDLREDLGMEGIW